jgi:hypothetical protein
MSDLRVPVWLREWMEAEKISLWGAAEVPPGTYLRNLFGGLSFRIKNLEKG